jgi:methionyl aminopeptidase
MLKFSRQYSLLHEDMISIKTTKEIEIMREGGRRLARLLHELAQRAVVGVTPNDLERYARAVITETGDTPAFLGYTPEGAPFPYPAATCISTNDAIVHGIPTDIPFAPGDVVSIDLGIRHGGLVVDASRTVIIGEGDAVSKKLVRVTQSALDSAIAQACAGNQVGDIGDAVKKVVRDTSFSIFKELGGHGVGTNVHEEPFVSNVGKAGTGPRLAVGMTLAIEVMLGEGGNGIIDDIDGYTYRAQDGSRTTQIEETVLVGENGPEILTRV